LGRVVRILHGDTVFFCHSSGNTEENLKAPLEYKPGLLPGNPFILL